MFRSRESTIDSARCCVTARARASSSLALSDLWSLWQFLAKPPLSASRSLGTGTGRLDRGPCCNQLEPPRAYLPIQQFQLGACVPVQCACSSGFDSQGPVVFQLRLWPVTDRPTRSSNAPVRIDTGSRKPTRTTDRRPIVVVPFRGARGRDPNRPR